jgi:hypothetical protein
MATAEACDSSHMTAEMRQVPVARATGPPLGSVAPARNRGTRRPGWATVDVLGNEREMGPADLEERCRNQQSCYGCGFEPPTLDRVATHLQLAADRRLGAPFPMEESKNFGRVGCCVGSNAQAIDFDLTVVAPAWSPFALPARWQ